MMMARSAGLRSGSIPLFAKAIDKRLFLLRGLQFGESRAWSTSDSSARNALTTGAASSVKRIRLPTLLVT